MAYESAPWAKHQSLLVGKAEPMVNTKHLSAEKKQLLWKAIKIKRPILAEMMTKDSDLLAIKEAFSGDFVFTEREFSLLIE